MPYFRYREKAAEELKQAQDALRDMQLNYTEERAQREVITTAAKLTKNF